MTTQTTHEARASGKGDRLATEYEQRNADYLAAFRLLQRTEEQRREAWNALHGTEQRSLRETN